MSYTPMSDESIDAITNVQWGQTAITVAHRTYARAIEAAATAPLLARIAELEAAMAEAIPAMREYARKNPKHHFSPDGLEQDPNGVHAWLAKNGAAMTPPEQPK